MAIEFLNSVDFNKNQIIAPAIESLATAPGTPVEGQMYFDSTALDKTMYFWNGTSWIEMDGTGSGVASLAIAAAGTNAGGINTSLVIDATIPANTLQPMQFGGSANIGMVPDASGGTDSVKFLKGDGTWATPIDLNYTYALSVGAVALNESILSLNASGGGTTTTAKFSGTTDEIEITTPATGDGGDITIGLPAAVTLTTSLTVSGAATRSSFAYQLTIPTTPLVSTDAASKGYVDGLVSGGLTFKGTFNASSGIIVSGSDTGSYLYNCPGGAGTRIAVTTGDYYVVATAGDFYCSAAEPLTVGDSIIGVSDAIADASVIGDWSIVQSDAGVTSVTASSTNDELGAIVSPTTGDVVVGVDIQSQTALAAAPALSDELLIYDDDASTNKKITVENLMQSATNGAYAVLNTTTTGVTQQVGPPAGTEGWVIAVGTILSATAAIHVACEVIRVSDGHTVITNVERSGTDITVNFVGSSIPQGTYAVILNRVA